MRVITQKTVGDASVLEVAEVAKPVPGPVSQMGRSPV